MVFWMPGAVRDYTLRVLPDVTEQDIGNGVLQELERFTGRACTSSLSTRALDQLSNRLFDRPVSIAILREGVESVRALPGNVIVVSHTLVEDYDTLMYWRVIYFNSISTMNRGICCNRCLRQRGSCQPSAC